MPKTTKSAATIDPVIKEQVENAIKATEDVIVVKIATLLREGFKSNKELLSHKIPPEISEKTRTDFTNFMKMTVSEDNKRVLQEVIKNPLFTKVLDQVASRVGMQFTKTISPAIIGILAKFTSPDDVIAFFQIQSIDDTHHLVDHLNANFTEQTLDKIFE